MPTRSVGFLVASALLSSGPFVSLAAQVVNPADHQRPKAGAPQGQPAQGEPVRVEGESVSLLREEDRIGSYGQPSWTAHRRFTETRVYVRPEGTFGFEYWVVPEVPEHGGAETAIQYEFEVGLPHRFQLDLYMVSHQQGNDGPQEVDQHKLEVRWAFADWDEIWGNPTAYLEWVANSNAPDHVEGKLLFGGEITSGLHWGSNLVFEHETGGAQENAYELTGGVSYTLRDEKVSVGAEVKAAFTDQKGNRGTYQDEVLVGPSLQFRPLPNAHIDIAALAGLTSDSPDAKFFFVFGWEF